MKMILEIEGALQRLHISFRRIDLSQSTLYFCNTQDTTFNLSLDSDGKLQIGRFLPVNVPADSEIAKIERQFEDHTACLETTEDQLFHFYVSLDLEDIPEEERQETVFRRIVGFLLTSGRLLDSLLGQGMEPADFFHSQTESNDAFDPDVEEE